MKSFKLYRILVLLLALTLSLSVSTQILFAAAPPLLANRQTFQLSSAEKTKTLEARVTWARGVEPVPFTVELMRDSRKINDLTSMGVIALDGVADGGSQRDRWESEPWVARWENLSASELYIYFLQPVGSLSKKYTVQVTQESYGFGLYVDYFQPSSSTSTTNAETSAETTVINPPQPTLDPIGSGSNSATPAATSVKPPQVLPETGTASAGMLTYLPLVLGAILLWPKRKR